MLDTYAFNIADVFKPASYFTSFGKLATDVITILVSAAGAIAIIFIIISGIKLVTSSGDPKKISSATGTLTYSLIGLAVVVLAFVIVQVVQAFFHVNVVNIGTDTGGGEGAPSCYLSTGSVAPGGTITVSSGGGLSGTIGMQGAYGTPIYSALGNLPAGGNTNITVPSTAQLGLYAVRVGGYGVKCSPDVSVTIIAAATCTYTPNSVAIGGLITVTSQNSLTGEIRIAGALWPQPATGSVLLGNLPANGTQTVTIPTSSTPPITVGSYAVRVGGFGVLCTTAGSGTSLSVTAGSSAFPITLGNPTINSNAATFSITNSSGGGVSAGSTLYIIDLASSITLTAGATSYTYLGPNGTHSAVIKNGGINVSDTITFTLTINYARADYNGDRILNDLDLQKIADNFGSLSPAILVLYDLNADGKINSLDMLIFSKYYLNHTY